MYVQMAIHCYYVVTVLEQVIEAPLCHYHVPICAIHLVAERIELVEYHHKRRFCLLQPCDPAERFILRDDESVFCYINRPLYVLVVLPIIAS